MSEWIDVISVDDLEPDDVTMVEVGNRQLAIYDASDSLYATQALCSHAGARLCDGYFEGHIVECPLHQGGFDIRDGRALYPPATRNLRVYPVKVVDGRVLVKVYPSVA